ncbi:TPA: restriction endonuclease subunit S, partial [Pseudomonas aeruginosa]|nr:restriction endonuclease subunit S [Pseudomonas aeruginosa]
WSVREVGDLCDVQGGLQVSKKRAGLPVTAPYLRVANVLRNRLDLTEIKEIELLESEYRRVKLIPDDILIVEGHGNANEIGRCAIWKGEIDEVVHQNHLIRVRVKSKDVNPRFLSDYINSSGGRAQMMRASNSTSGLNTISTGVVRSTGVIVPPKDLQDKYALIVEKTNSNLLRQNFAQVLIGESVFSLSQKAFSGQL